MGRACVRRHAGVAIAQALLEALVSAGARVAITTHYVQLKELAQCDQRFTVGAMEVGQRPARHARLARTSADPTRVVLVPCSS